MYHVSLPILRDLKMIAACRVKNRFCVQYNNNLSPIDPIILSDLIFTI